MEVLIPSYQRSGSRPFAGLVINSQQAQRAQQLFVRCLKDSFDVDEKRMGKFFRTRVQTQAEMKRRAQIMARWFRVFRGDLGYSLARCEAELGRALRCELDGELYTPPPAKGSFGVPEGETQ